MIFTEQVDNMPKILWILRGAPGSGKSTWAKNNFKKHEIFSTDDFFLTKTGEYRFNRQKIGLAHRWNLQRAKDAMTMEIQNVVIDNTNVRRKDFQKYIDKALESGYRVEEKVFEVDAETSYKRNSHKVPRDVCERMVATLTASLKDE
jgi:predicted kinase